MRYLVGCITKLWEKVKEEDEGNKRGRKSGMRTMGEEEEMGEQRPHHPPPPPPPGRIKVTIL